METAVLSPVPQPFDGFLALVVGKIAGILTSTHYGRVQQTGSAEPHAAALYIFDDKNSFVNF